MFTLKIETDNAAFEPQPECEVATILAQLAEQLQESGPVSGTLRDSNGNTVGHYQFI